MLSQPSRSSVVSCLHSEATATSAASVMLQRVRPSVVSCLHFEATASTAASVMLPRKQFR
eukprot:scaffold31765_cov67-Phaeocystis_antarctica.AAC.1